MANEPKIVIEHFHASFDGKPVLRGLNLQVFPRERLALIGPAGGGKSTLLRSLNRMNDLAADFARQGRILVDGVDILGPHIDIALLRRRLGMVTPMPNPLPCSVEENITLTLKMAGIRDAHRVVERLETGLKNVHLWEEVKDRLAQPALHLNNRQQQLLCLARVLALEPEVLLLDKPCSGLDPVAANRFEDVLADLKSRYTIILATNDSKQAARASDRTALIMAGELVEWGSTHDLFFNPANAATKAYITGRF